MCSLVVALAVSAAAMAQPVEADRPWASGVPREQQVKALDLFREANGKLRDAHYTAAREQYLEALKVWDHPAIHYNLALALLNLDRPLEAYEHLVRSLKYGALPLDQDKLEQGLRYKGLIEKQLTKLVVLCSLQGAVVQLDGAQLFVGPGRWEGMVRAGPHSLGAARDGYVPVAETATFVGGETKELELTLLRTEEMTEYRRRWTPAIEWSVLAGGLALIGGGVGLRFAAQDVYSTYDASVKSCATTVSAGCPPRPEIASLRARGDALQALSVTGYVVGGAAVVTGAILAYLNRPLPFLRAVGVSIAPAPQPGAGVVVSVALP